MELKDKDYLEIEDMNAKELMKYSYQELKGAAIQFNSELEEMKGYPRFSFDLGYTKKDLATIIGTIAMELHDHERGKS